MQKIIVTRKMDELGRICIPTKIRRELNMNSGDSIVIEALGNEIAIYKQVDSCKICGKVAVEKINNSFICNKCITDIKLTKF